jgi:hypothetical protein
MEAAVYVAEVKLSKEAAASVEEVEWVIMEFVTSASETLEDGRSGNDDSEEISELMTDKINSRLSL